MTSADNSRNLFDRRSVITGLSVLGGVAAGAALLGGSAISAMAQGRPPKITEVPVEKLMAKGELPDITVGSKDAKVTIVEYASMTCPHCKDFHENVYPKLKEKYVDTGKVLFVMREFPLDQLAAAVSMLVRCQGLDKAPGAIGVFFKTQDEWRTRNPVPKLLEISKQMGMTQESFEKCLDNQAMLDKLAKQRDEAAKDFGVNATPSFFINGKRFDGRSDSVAAFEAAIDPLVK